MTIVGLDRMGSGYIVTILLSFRKQKKSIFLMYKTQYLLRPSLQVMSKSKATSGQVWGLWIPRGEQDP